MTVFKLLRPGEWATLMRDGALAGSPDDLRDGFVHLSAAGQVEGTLARHFAGAEDVLVCAVAADRLGEALRWEPSRGGALFPHLYRPLRLADLLWVRPVEGGALPEGVA